MMRLVVLLLLLFNSLAATAAEIIVLSAANSLPAVREIAPLFEKISGHRAAVQFAFNPAIKQRIEAGERFDVVILEPELLDDLARSRKVVSGSVIPIAQVGMGLLARAGVPKADISTIDGLKATIRSAASLAYNADGHSGTVFLQTLERLDLAQEMKPRLRPVIGPAAALVAKGEVQLYAGPVSVPPPGTTIVGRFPEQVQTFIGISAGLSSAASTPDVARAFMMFLVSTDAAAIFTKAGYYLPKQ